MAYWFAFIPQLVRAPPPPRAVVSHVPAYRVVSGPTMTTCVRCERSTPIAETEPHSALGRERHCANTLECRARIRNVPTRP